jgi:hypothetical protein
VLRAMTIRPMESDIERVYASTGRSHDGGRSRKVLLQLQKPTHFVDEPSEPRKTSKSTAAFPSRLRPYDGAFTVGLVHVAATTRGKCSIRIPSVNRTMSERLRLADLLSGLCDCFRSRIRQRART